LSPRPRHPSALIRSLARISEENPVGPRLVVASSFGEGSELLRALALDAGGWAGFEVTTTGRLAARIAGPLMADRGLKSMDRFQETALVDAVLDEVLAEGEWPRLSLVGEGPGFREAVARAVASLRMAEVGPDALTATLQGSERAALLAAVMEAFERHLEAEGLADPVRTLEVALEGLQRGQGPPSDSEVILVPGLTTDGCVGRLVAALRERGARLLTADGVEGISPPRGLLWDPGPVTGVGGFLFAPAKSTGGGGLSFGLFRAASVREELPVHLNVRARKPLEPPREDEGASPRERAARTALRRRVDDLLARSLPVPVPAVATPDPEVYAPALDALCAELDIPASFGMGLPVARTRPGRAIEGYLRWIENGYPSGALRTLLEAGDLGPAEAYPDVRPRSMARRLREMTVGWGRQRYGAAVERARRRLEREAARDPFDSERRREARRQRSRELDALEELFGHVEKTTPWTPDPYLGESGSVSAGELAEGVLGFLGRVPATEGADEVARRDLEERLERISTTLRRKTSFEAAIAALRTHLRIRVRAAWDEGSPPWKSSGGHLHLTDLAHGGLTGRQATFVVGLDAGRFPGAGHQDPLLLDEERARLDAQLHSSAHGLHLRKFQLAILASRVRGTLTLSYTAWESREGRTVQPAPVLLDAHRLATGDPDASFESLEKALGPPVAPAPAGTVALDDQDVWLGAARRGGTLSLPQEAVREVFERLDRGMEARDQAARPRAGPFRGKVRARPEELDPRLNPEVVLSARRLESLGACPLRYFYRYVLRVRPPEEVKREPDRWLDPLHRGNLLHQVFEEVMRDFPDGSQEDAEEAVLERGMEVLRRRAGELREERPAPSNAVYRRELAALGGDLRSFASAVAEDGAPWVALELAFGRDESDPVEIALPGGLIRLMGKIDRIDRLPGGLRIVDYKTGGAYGFGPKEGPYNGGRRLQHVLYSEAVERLRDEEVERFEYHFPTPRGLNRVESFEREDLRQGLGLLERLMELAGAGNFLPTNEADDCRLCDFAPVCRVRVGDYDTDSPMAEWGEDNFEMLPEYAELRDVRRFGDDS